jgi:hypothetical protein
MFASACSGLILLLFLLFFSDKEAVPADVTEGWFLMNEPAA